MYYIRIASNIVNIISLIWNFITLLASKISINIVGILWCYNISGGIFIVERYFPEIKQKWAKYLLYSIVGLAHILGFIMFFTEQMDLNTSLCIFFNIICFIFSLIYFFIVEANLK